ncbi:MAG: arginine deiminase-related protein [Phycisphaerales bacterium]|nr:arginine deiminase-related protein [Phycisphaerales bacterium]
MNFQLIPERFQTANRVLMIRPLSFGYHSQAAQSNAFMNQPEGDDSKVSVEAQSEFDGLVRALRESGVEVLVYQDERGLPDCVFPNNWMSWHTPQDSEQVVITYPMCNELRRAERSSDVLDVLCSGVGGVGHLDLSGLEEDSEILEGTGSLVLDRVQGVAYGCVSPRTTESAVESWCDETGYSAFLFRASDRDGEPIYHTNVVMSVGSKLAVVCDESIADLEERENLIGMLQQNHRTVIRITMEQMRSFCGNILELVDQDSNTIFAMSSRAFAGFTAQQQQVMRQLGKIVHVPIPTIENVGGGSVRCMIAEVGRT